MYICLFMHISSLEEYTHVHNWHQVVASVYSFILLEFLRPCTYITYLNNIKILV